MALWLSGIVAENDDKTGFWLLINNPCSLFLVEFKVIVSVRTGELGGLREGRWVLPGQLGEEL